MYNMYILPGHWCESYTQCKNKFACLSGANAPARQCRQASQAGPLDKAIKLTADAEVNVKHGGTVQHKLMNHS